MPFVNSLTLRSATDWYKSKSQEFVLAEIRIAPRRPLARVVGNQPKPQAG